MTSRKLSLRFVCSLGSISLLATSSLNVVSAFCDKLVDGVGARYRNALDVAPVCFLYGNQPFRKRALMSLVFAIRVSRMTHRAFASLPDALYILSASLFQCPFFFQILF